MSDACILAPDDSPMLLRTVKLARKKVGFWVTTRASLGDLEAGATPPPNVILMDTCAAAFYDDDVRAFCRDTRGVLKARALAAGATGTIGKGWGVDISMRWVQNALATPA